MRRRLVTTIALSVTLAAGGTAAAAQAATLGPVFLGGNGKKAKPRTVGVGAKGAFEKLRWRNWGKTNAYAKGVYDIAGFANDPGTGYRSSISIRAYGLKRCASGNSVYTKVRYRVAKPMRGKRLFRETFTRC